MALAKTLSAALSGAQANVVRVEANIGPGLPGTFIVGLGDAAVGEARDRLKTAAANARLCWPKTKVMVNLSPASMPKHGTMMDLAICMAILGAGAERFDIEHVLFLGEVGLDGRIAGVRGVAAGILAAADAKVHIAVVPQANAEEAACVAPEHLTVLVGDNIAQVAKWCQGEVTLEQARSTQHVPTRHLNMLDVVGQQQAKRAAMIAAAGGHHFMMIGPPGSGKSMIAKRFAGLLPPLPPEQERECRAICSITGEEFSGPPFVAPHHSVSKASLLGGGSGLPKPGAVTKAHRGVLFLDEVSEIAAGVLDALRVPLDRGKVELLRANGSMSFPAQFQLVLAANPCRCGAAEARDCECKPQQRARYLQNLSGPLRDRLDMVVRTEPKGSLRELNGMSSEEMAQGAARARMRAQQRFASMGMHATNNARVPAGRLRKDLQAAPDAMALLESYLAVGALSQRAVDRTLRLAWTIADLAASTTPNIDHVAEALEYNATMQELIA
ncbi:YifB family Mg chelatase-like AAA ATPase [Corynebacterium pelargi]|uniref:Competence protein ComM n=1 Tax=Corynebacterium pelargi TaxID=1471400 RepID=A0A410W836_9CORY|nr:YifB family Mg chelatase-like AAA ATPase [Corynebacterium pelargi]QAU52119.1 Competence protein ComM [Corynebacterium pelargi]GGG70005.1 ATPase [Corynebacterium pelargi]